VFQAVEGQPLPAIGSDCYVIPTHICPTSALYPRIEVAQGGSLSGEWQVEARNRKISF
jgi:D-serine deaminase-like pyridoxal phosphate-dependent protein